MKYATDITQQKLQSADYEGQLAAISKAQAVIEFGLDGKILNANDNFLKMLGYTLDEVKGQHHSMFVEHAYRQSADYRLFWEKLGRGEYDAGQYKRVGKNGAEIWIQASYNPILDVNGKPFKVVKYATDITASVRASQVMQQAVQQVQAAVEAAKANDLTERVPLEGKTGEIESLCAGVNGLLDTMATVVTRISNSAREVSSASAEISTSTTDLSQRTEEQAASLEETSASMEQMSATVKKNAENAQQANQSAGSTRDVADRGGQVVAKAVEAMARIEESSRKISDIIGVIDEIARQTNLLALNAAVEAARAGEAGRGFAVVASEVRSLAQRSSQAAKDIKDLITNSNSQVKDGVDLVNKAGTALNEIVESIKKVADIVSDIAAASAEQAAGIEQVNKALTQMDEVTQQNSALVEENAATAKTLEQQAKSMDDEVSVFRVDASAASAGAAAQKRPATVAPRAAEAKAPASKTAGHKPASAPRAAGNGRANGAAHSRLAACKRRWPLPSPIRTGKSSRNGSSPLWSGGSSRASDCRSPNSRVCILGSRLPDPDAACLRVRGDCSFREQTKSDLQQAVAALACAAAGVRSATIATILPTTRARSRISSIPSLPTTPSFFAKRIISTISGRMSRYRSDSRRRVARQGSSARLVRRMLDRRGAVHHRGRFAARNSASWEP